MRWISSLAVIMVCHLLSMAQTILNPEFDRTDQPLFHIEKVEHTTDSTIVECTLFVEDVLWANISPNTYLENVSDHKKYRISRCEGLPFAPCQRTFSNSKKCNVIMSFPFCGDSDKINLIEPPNKKSFNVYGISMKNSNEDNLENSIEQASLLSSKANYYFTINDYEKAAQYEKQAINIKKCWFGKLSKEYENSLFMLGLYYSCSLKFEKALECFEEDNKIRAQLYGEHTESYSDVLKCLAICYQNQNMSSQAIPCYETALKIREETSGKYNSEYAQTKGLLAQSYYSIGDIPKAIETAEEATKLKKQLLGTHDADYLISLLNLAQYSMWRDLNKSKDMFVNIVDTTRIYFGKENQLYLIASNALSQCFLILNKTVDAMSYARENAEISLKMYGEESIMYSISMNLLSQIYEIMLDYDNAISCDLKSIQFVKSKIPAIQLSKILYSIATCYAKKSEYSNALKYSQEAIQVFKNFMIHDFDNMTAEQKYSLWRNLHRIYDSGYPVYVANSITKENIIKLYDNALFFKGITLNDNISRSITWEMIKNSLNENDIAIEFIESHSEGLPNKYFALIIKKGYESPKMINLFEMSQVEDVLKKECSSYSRDSILGDLIWGSLREDIIDVENIYLSPVGVLHSVAIENLPINSHDYYSEKYNIYRLSSTRELADSKERKPYKTAILFGGLNYNSDDDNTNQTVDVDRNGYDYLANTDQEIREIADILASKNIKTSAYSGLEGTERVFKQFNKHNFEILHIATHGESIQRKDVEAIRNSQNFNFLRMNSINNYVYEDDALSWSFLLLSGGNQLINRVNENFSDNEDGVLNATEISKMDFQNLDLVVMSACKTALGVIGVDNSVLGLQRSFKRAGANTILMSLDKVDDEATRILMVEFYRNLMNGKTKHQSLQEAQQYLRKVENGKYDDPKYWASFIMLDGLN